MHPNNLIYSDKTLSEERNIQSFSLRSLRIICLFAIIVNLFYVLYGGLVGVREISIICAFYMLGGVSSLLMTYFNQVAAKFLVITSTAISLMITFHTFTIGYNVLTIFFPVLLAHVYIFNFDTEKKTFFFSLAITIASIVLSLTMPRFHFLKVPLNENIANQTDSVHTLVCLAVTTFLLIIIIQNRTQLNRLVHLKKKDLEAAINELTETRDQLIQTEKMASLGLLTAGINHEINNPLNFMAGGLENLKIIAKKNDIEPVIPFLHVFEEGIKRIEDIVSGLNHFNHQSTSFEDKCQINDILENCLKVLSHELKDRISIVKDYTSDSAVKGNSGQLHQVFINLLSNAAQAIKGVGEIKVNTSRDANELVVVIADNGPGIPENLLMKIFDPFYTTKEPGIGTGLGLSVSYSIIKKHLGAIKVTSTEGSGTTFTISLPV